MRELGLLGAMRLLRSCAEDRLLLDGVASARDRKHTMALMKEAEDHTGSVPVSDFIGEDGFGLQTGRVRSRVDRFSEQAHSCIADRYSSSTYRAS